LYVWLPTWRVPLLLLIARRGLAYSRLGYVLTDNGRNTGSDLKYGRTLKPASTSFVSSAPMRMVHGSDVLCTPINADNGKN